MIDKLKPALLGGLIAGILSVIPIVSTCCCLWAILGGVLASFLYIKSSAAPVTTGQGAGLGAMAGAVGALIYIIIGLPINLFFGTAQKWRTCSGVFGMAVPLGGIALILLGVFMVAVLILISVPWAVSWVYLFLKSEKVSNRRHRPIRRILAQVLVAPTPRCKRHCPQVSSKATIYQN